MYKDINATGLYFSKNYYQKIYEKQKIENKTSKIWDNYYKSFDKKIYGLEINIQMKLLLDLYLI